MIVKDMNFEAKAISRRSGKSGNRSAVGMAAYRAGDKLKDKRYQEVRDYSRKRGIYGSEIIAPSGSPDWTNNREELWNNVEASEKRYDARVCREFIISLPREMTHDHKQEVIRDFVRENFTKKRLISDISYHDFTGRHSHNPHCHVMLTTRPLKGGKFENKDRNLDKQETLEGWRKSYMDIANGHLERKGYDIRITTESFKTRGITDRAPISESMAVTQMRKKHSDKPDKFPLPEIAKQNDELKRMNKQLADLQNELVKAEEREKREREYQEKSTDQQTGSDKDKAYKTAVVTTEEITPANQNQPAKDIDLELDEDTRQLIRQWQEYRDRERHKPRRPDDREERGYDLDEYER